MKHLALFFVASGFAMHTCTAQMTVHTGSINTISRPTNNFGSQAHNTGNRAATARYTSYHNSIYPTGPMAAHYTHYNSIARANNNLTTRNYKAGNRNYNTSQSIKPFHTRYNPIIKKDYPYYTSSYAHRKRALHDHDHVRMGVNPFFERIDNIPFYDLLFDCSMYYIPDIYVYNNSLISAKNISLDGYIVYDKDTLSGIVTVTNNTVYLEQPVDDKKEYGYRYNYKDKKLEGVTVFKDEKQLWLTRLDKDNRLWRVVHYGKLSLYDDRYNFIFQPGDIDKATVRAVYKGSILPLNTFLTIDNKKKLTELINNAYSLQLDYKEYNWDKLLTYIDALD